MLELVPGVDLLPDVLKPLTAVVSTLPWCDGQDLAPISKGLTLCGPAGRGLEPSVLFVLSSCCVWGG